MSQRKSIKLSKLHEGPIRHESLPSNLLNAISAIYEAVGRHLDTTLEQFEVGFMRDAHPEREVLVWCDIVEGWCAYHEQHLDEEMLPDDEEKKLLAAMILISTGERDIEKLGVPAIVGRRLLNCYEGMGMGPRG